jgi:beta-alanine degradation protein BauB
MRPLSVIPLLIASLLLFASPLQAQSGPPKQEKLVFENQFVKVYELTLQPGEKLPEHHGGNRLVYCLNDCKLLYHWDGKTYEEKRKAGDVHFHPEATHAEENPGKTTVREIIVERQNVPLPAPSGTGLDMAAANPNNTKVIFDRDMAKVFQVTLQPKDAASMHYCLDRLIYAPQSSQFNLIGSDGSKTKQSIKKGGYQWYPSGLQALENSSGARETLVVFAFKK